MTTMKFYTEDTGNRNRSQSPTPYLCLKARLSQIILNDTLLLLLFAVMIITLVVDVSQNKTSGLTISEKTATMTSSPDVYRVYAQQTLDTLVGDINVTQTGLESQLRVVQLLQIQRIEDLAKQKKSVAKTVASSITHNVTSAINSLNATLVQKLDAQNGVIDTVKTKIESMVLSVGSSLNLDTLDIDVSSLMDDVWAILETLPTSFDTDSYDDSDQVEKTSKELWKSYNSSIDLISDCFSEFRTNITELIPPPTPPETANATDHTIKLSESYTEGNPKSPLPVYLCLGLLSLLTLPLYFLWEWKCYTYEQKMAKSLADEITTISDTGALVHRVFDVTVYSVTPWLLSLIRLVWPTYPLDNDVHLCWLGSFMYGWQSRMRGALKVLYIVIVVYCSTCYLMGNTPSSASSTAVVATNSFTLSFESMGNIQASADTMLTILNKQVASELESLQKDVEKTLSESVPELSIDLPTIQFTDLPDITTAVQTYFTASTNTKKSNSDVASKGILEIWSNKLKYYIIGVVGILFLQSLSGLALTVSRLRTFQHDA